MSAALPDPANAVGEPWAAREYNPANGRFLSVDPVLEAGDPNQLNGYDYAGNDPVTGSDPSGLKGRLVRSGVWHTGRCCLLGSLGWWRIRRRWK